MAQSQFSLTWESHKRNMCTGLSSLQQNNEFVDMTLAAEGHFVKVHQVIIALSSPYFKDLLASAPCQHPVVFLNKVSYTTLSLILEYIYTGEVYINVENLLELIEAAKELKIKGLEDMKLPEITSVQEPDVEDEMSTQEHDYNDENSQIEALEEGTCYLEISNLTMDEKPYIIDDDSYSVVECKEQLLQHVTDHTYEETIKQDQNADDTNENETLPNSDKNITTLFSNNAKASVIQYTVSNQGSLQMILNRYIYYLKHTNKNKSQQWRCIDYLNSKKCPAYVVSKDGVIILSYRGHRRLRLCLTTFNNIYKKFN
uniref:BTB domain-containing protein n=1 Tax=Bombyx mori TaxID=7091 RepID=A0A8R2G929_BOMMO|nr:uncharacterized protein LOC101742337 isoform X2 [Bombyx mori]